MIISFYDKDFKALQNNSGLVIDNNSYSLIKRPVDMNEFSCVCEAFIENIQPTFLVVKDDKGSNNLVYSSLAGIPLLNNNNQTEINGTDIKSMLSSEILVEKKTFTTVNEYITYIFNEWNNQSNQNSFKCVLEFKKYTDKESNEIIEPIIPLTDLKPELEKVVEKKNAWEEIQSYLKFYNLYIDTALDLVAKQVNFIIGKTMFRNMNIKLWEYGIKNYGKWVADTNECQGYYLPNNATSKEQLVAGFKWILTSQNKVTTDETKRDIYPIKRKIVISSKSKEEADKEALTQLLDSLYNENIELPTQTIKPDFETNFAIYVKRGEDKYKDLPCGELRYDATGLVKVQIGYRYTDVSFI